MRFAFISAKKSFSHASLALGLALMFLSGTGSAAAKLKSLPIDGTKTVIKETKVLEPYNTTDEYAYSKGETYDRWVYSPWVVKSFNDAEQRIENPARVAGRALLAADLSLPVDLMAAGKLYTMDVKTLFGCKGATDKPATTVCSVEIALNCYGYVGDKWSRTFQMVKSLDAKADGEFLLAGAQIDPAKCAKGVHLGLRGNLAVEGKSFAIRQVEIMVKEAAK